MPDLSIHKISYTSVVHPEYRTPKWILRDCFQMRASGCFWLDLSSVEKGIPTHRVIRKNYLPNQGTPRPRCGSARRSVEAEPATSSDALEQSTGTRPGRVTPGTSRVRECLWFKSKLRKVCDKPQRQETVVTQTDPKWCVQSIRLP